MSMSDCIRCWDTPCTCGYEYRKMSKEKRIELASVVLGVDKKILTERFEDFIGERHSYYDDYISTAVEMPKDGEKVLAKFEGIYIDRKVTFWIDPGGTHFGLIDESDGKGSQPATHWKRIE